MGHCTPEFQAVQDFQREAFQSLFQKQLLQTGPRVDSVFNCSTLQIGITWWYDFQSFSWAGLYPLPFGAACNGGNGTLHFEGLPGLGKGSADPCCYPCFLPCFSFCSRRLPLFAKDTLRWKVFSNKKYRLLFSAFCMSFSFLCQRNHSADDRVGTQAVVDRVHSWNLHTLEVLSYWCWSHKRGPFALACQCFVFQPAYNCFKNIYHITLSTLDVFFLSTLLKLRLLLIWNRC